MLTGQLGIEYGDRESPGHVLVHSLSPAFGISGQFVDRMKMMSGELLVKRLLVHMIKYFPRKALNIFC